VIDRRTFLAGAAAAAASRAARVLAADPPRLETFSDWLHATREARDAALQPAVDRIRAADESIHAWVQVLPQKSTGSGALAGIPYGAKDIIETRGLATEYGSPIYKGRIGADDAAIVRELRQRGAVLMGKTHTTSFAYRTPAPTRNPRNLEHTPGGSSSGSAAAVAAGMVPFALGTQTGGSVLRPASFCGITGFKPTFGTLPLEGVLPFAKSLDTLGLFTHTPVDMLAWWTALGHPAGRAEDIVFGAPEPMLDVEPAMTAAFQRALTTLRGAGITIRPIELASMLATLVRASRTVMFYEGARFHEARYQQYGDRMADMGELVREGLQISTPTCDDARRQIAEAKKRIAERYASTPVILVPAATGPAPRGLQSTGDSRMNAPWTALGVPAITIPMAVGAALPLGLQLTAAQGEDARVLQSAVRLHRILRGAA
jgi:Asp-tRNA(Asn)/Glu-tRNA(Gln) amidotransferase A subunit family amidase